MQYRRFTRFAVAVAALLAVASSVDAAEKYSLRAAKPDGSPWRVVVNLEVGGHLKIAAEKKVESVPMSVVAQFSYDEQRLDDGTAADHRLALRWYDGVTAVIKAGDRMAKPTLRDSRRLLAVAAGDQAITVVSPAGPLTREELDLAEVPANTLILDDLLPTGELAIGESWKPTDEALARLLVLDAVAQADVKCTLKAVNGDVAEIEFAGPLSGAIKGVASQAEVKGRMMFNISRGQPSEVILAVKEDRGVGHASPGLDVVAKLKLTISPLAESKMLTPAVVQGAKLPQTGEAQPLEYISQSPGFRFLYDRRWHVIGDSPELIMMRFIDRGDLVAQCNLMPAVTPLKEAISLDQFQREVQAGLGTMFSQFEHASEGQTPTGLRKLRTVAIGKAEDLPIQWRYYSLHNREGQAVTAAFTIETPLVEQFGDGDSAIMDSFEFLTPSISAADSDASIR